MEERGGAGQHKGAASCGLALGSGRVRGVTGGQRGATGVEEAGGCREKKPESQKARTGAGVERWGVMGRKGGSEGETAQHRQDHSWSGCF